MSPEQTNTLSAGDMEQHTKFAMDNWANVNREIRERRNKILDELNALAESNDPDKRAQLLRIVEKTVKEYAEKYPQRNRITVHDVYVWITDTDVAARRAIDRASSIDYRRELEFWNTTDSLSERLSRTKAEPAPFGTDKKLKRYKDVLKLSVELKAHLETGARLVQTDGGKTALAAATKELAQDIAGLEKGLKELLDDIATKTDDIAERAQATLDMRLPAARKNVAASRAVIQDLGWRGRLVAWGTGNRASLDATVEADEQVVADLEKYEADLKAALGKEDPVERLDAVIAVAKAMRMQSNYYVDAQGHLSRTMERLDRMWNNPDRPAFQVDQEVYIAVSADRVEKGWMITEVANGTCTVKKGDEEKTVKTSEMWHVSEIEGGRTLASNVPGHQHARLLNREHTLMERYSGISREEYRRLFTGSLRQTNTELCYLHSAMISLDESPYKEVLLRSSVRKRGENYIVKVPLGDADGTPITVSPADLEPQKVKDDRKGRTELLAIDASEGWQVVEAAYIKHAVGTLDRRKVEGGFSTAALQRLLSSSAAPSDDVRTSKSSFAEDARAWRNAQTWLATFSKETHIASVGTPRGPNGEDDDKTFDVDGMTFSYRHSYSLRAVDTENETVDVVNPHRPTRVITLTYAQFSQVFNHIEAVKINRDRLYRV